MFFMIGITDGRKDLDFHQTITCAECGRMSRYMLFMTYTVLSLFFIPCFKWNKRYFVQTACCNTVYELNPEIGKRIAAGEDITIKPEDLTRLNTGSRRRICRSCGYSTDEDFEYCPKCGRPF